MRVGLSVLGGEEEEEKMQLHVLYERVCVVY